MSADEPEVHGDSWVYLAAHHRPSGDEPSGALLDALIQVCERSGFAVVASASAKDDVGGPPHWLDALRYAEMCVIDVGIGSTVTGVELAFAYCEERPLIALRAQGESLPAALLSLTAKHGALREIVFTDVDDCVDQLERVIADPAWQQLIRSATTADQIEA